MHAMISTIGWKYIFLSYNGMLNKILRTSTPVQCILFEHELIPAVPINQRERTFATD